MTQALPLSTSPQGYYTGGPFTGGVMAPRDKNKKDTINEVPIHRVLVYLELLPGPLSGAQPGLSQHWSFLMGGRVSGYDTVAGM
jgi:hypothetical protein